MRNHKRNEIQGVPVEVQIVQVDQTAVAILLRKRKNHINQKRKMIKTVKVVQAVKVMKKKKIQVAVVVKRLR